ncbi:SLC13 family permease [Vibrio sp. 188UL20-2]|uniref:SLC13 family permease n=2 Tax=Vibrio ulleungensis TaxID=2807619 RepID=A0ABS2HJN4_9VIBR|nr:SLC13 family permease [Vibrio ulleungensis]MBM7037723.1 SLC13 family permease [Vibrio ulleungensis]
MLGPYGVFGLFFLTIVGLIRFPNKPEKVFGVLMVSLVLLRLISTEQLVDSATGTSVLSLVLILVCSLALEKTWLLREVAKSVISANYARTWGNLFVFSTLFSAFLNNTAVVSTMLSPIRNNPHHPASKLLLPLSYAAILGGTLTLVGTSTNLIVNSMVIKAGYPPLSFFEFSKVGAALVVSCGAVLVVVSRWLPSNTKPQRAVSDYFIDAQVGSDSQLVGKSIEQNGLRNLESLFLVEIVRDNQLITPVAPSEIVLAGDRLLFSGDIKKVTLLNQFSGLSTFASENGLPLQNLSEVIVRPDSRLVGRTLKSVGFRALFDAAVVAIKRDGKRVSGKLGDAKIKPGDFLILAAGEDYHARRNLTKNFFLLSGVETERTLHPWQEHLAVLGFLSALAGAALGWVSLFDGLFVLFATLLFSRTLTPNEVLQRLPVQIWLIISSAIAFSVALENSGGTALLKSWIVSLGSYASPLLLLVLIYMVTWLLTELVTNNAAAALLLPIALGVAEALGVDPMPFIMVVAFGASASFISPYGYQTNLMVFNAGQYSLKDFAKVGIPLALTYGVVSVVGVTLVYF